MLEKYAWDSGGIGRLCAEHRLGNRPIRSRFFGNLEPEYGSQRYPQLAISTGAGSERPTERLCADGIRKLANPDLSTRWARGETRHWRLYHQHCDQVGGRRAPRKYTSKRTRKLHRNG